MTFFSHRLQIFKFPLFSLFQSISPISDKFFIPPTFVNFPSYFVKFPCFLHTFCIFSFFPTLTMIHLCITQCTYWTPLDAFMHYFGTTFHLINLLSFSNNYYPLSFRHLIASQA